MKRYWNMVAVVTAVLGFFAIATKAWFEMGILWFLVNLFGVFFFGVGVDEGQKGN